MVNYAELATEHNKKVNTLAGQLEKINDMLGITKASAKIAIVDDNRIAHYMDDYLTTEQQKAIVNMVESSINAVKVVQESEFNKLIGVNKDIKIEIDADKKESNVPERILHSDFIKDYESGMGKQELATKYDIAPSTVYGYASKLGIKRNQAKAHKEEQTTVELTKDLVWLKYTTTDEKIEVVAKELGVTKFELHDFIAKNGLRRESKRNQEIFRDTEVQKKKLTPSKAK